VYRASSTSPTLQAILQPHYHIRTTSIVLQPRTMTRSRLKGALSITTVDSHNLLVAGNLSRTLRSRSLVQPRGSPLLRRFGVRGLLRPLSASSVDPSQRACLTVLSLYVPSIRRGRPRRDLPCHGSYQACSPRVDASPPSRNLTYHLC
jgi:hypothetical protein